jgi:hypothetical protein
MGFRQVLGDPAAELPPEFHRFFAREFLWCVAKGLQTHDFGLKYDCCGGYVESMSVASKGGVANE